MIAQNLADTLNVFDPGPLEGSELDTYYVERPMSQLNEMRVYVERRLSELLDRMNEVLDDITRNARRRILIIVEDIDKLDLATARELFQDHAISLTTPRAHIIYTFPIALRNMNDFITSISQAAADERRCGTRSAAQPQPARICQR